MAGVRVLVAEAMRGDRAALEALWAQHRRYAATVIIAHKPSTADTDDLLQEVAATMVSKIHTLSAPSNFLPWLRMVALNVARLAGRKQAAAIVRPDSELVEAGGAHEGGAGRLRASTPGGGAPGVAGKDHAQQVMAFARQLPDEYREPLLLQTLREMSYRQIGAALGLPETTIETRIARARKMLRELARKADRDAAAGVPAGGRLAGAAAG